MPACKLRILPPRESERGVLILLEGFRNEFCVYKYPSPLSSPCADLAEMESRLMMTTETFILQGQPTFFAFHLPSSSRRWNGTWKRARWMGHFSTGHGFIARGTSSLTHRNYAARTSSFLPQPHQQPPVEEVK